MNNKESQYANFKYFKSWKETVRVLRKLNANFKENDKNIVVSFIQKKDMQIYPRQGDCIRVEMKLCLEAAYIHVPDKYYRIRIDLDDVEKRINPTPFVDLENIEGFLTGIYNYINHIKNEESEIEIERSSSVVGSPEWFYEKSQTDMIRKFQEWIEKKRERFIARFSPECLSEMSGKELLENVFSSSDDSLARILMNDESFRNFGAAGKYSYLGIVFYNRSKGAWNYRVGSEDVFLNEDEAREKAELVRDDLLYCIGSIEEIGSFETIDDYVILQNRISKVPFYDYSWIIKYYQMLYPQYFPGMYAPDTLKRALNILGLPYHGTTNKILNLGEISLFIRRCNVNNIMFNDIYGSEWGWDSDQGPCPSARSNYESCSVPVTNTNMKLYKTPKSRASRVAERVKEAEEIEKAIDSTKLEGKEREAVVKVRVNQGEFRKQLLSRYSKCCLCNVSSPEFLIASHIKPWSECEPDERLDPDNGLLLCPNHDKLFDSGYISFDDSGNILISEKVSEIDRRFLNVHKDMSIKVSDGNVKYLKYHREKLFDY